MDLYGISAELLTEIANVPIEKARRWKRAGKVPARVQAIVQLRLSTDLGVLDPASRGYVIRNGLLWTPENDSLTPAQIRAAPWWRGLAKIYEEKLKQPQQYELL